MSNKDGGLDSQDKQVYSIHNYSLSIDENGFNLSMSVLKKINESMSRM
jgi:hypothetical protein